jgi:hypothetical protein
VVVGNGRKDFVVSNGDLFVIFDSANVGWFVGCGRRQKLEVFKMWGIVPMADMNSWWTIIENMRLLHGCYCSYTRLAMLAGKHNVG